MVPYFSLHFVVCIYNAETFPNWIYFSHLDWNVYFASYKIVCIFTFFSDTGAFDYYNGHNLYHLFIKADSLSKRNHSTSYISAIGSIEYTT